MLQAKVAGGRRTSHRMAPVPNHQHSSANSAGTVLDRQQEQAAEGPRCRERVACLAEQAGQPAA